MAGATLAVSEPFGPAGYPDGNPPDLPALHRLESEITELWGHINAGEHRFLELVAEYDRLEGWALHGLANCAQWLNWQCGIGEVAARERVRVARSLEGLPKIADAFRRGVISYSKVRAVTRVATPANETDLLNIAEHGTAAHVERLVNKYRRLVRREDAERANALHRHRALYFFYDEDDSVVIHAKLPPEIGAVVQKAIEEAMAVLEKDEALDAQEHPQASALRDMANETHSNVSAESLEAAHEQMNKFESLTVRRADALRLLAESFLARRTDECGSAADRIQVVVHVDQRVLVDTEPLPGEAAARRCELENERALALATVRRLGCDASLVGILEDGDGEPLSVGRKTRSIPPALARALKARDGGCRFPGCGRTRFTEGHHVKHWANGGETKLDNLITLCRFHHRLIHEGGFGLHVMDDGPERDMFVFTRPDGTRIEANGRLRLRGDDSPRNGAGQPGLFDLNRERGLSIDLRTSRCEWQGERMDYGLAIGGLFWHREQALRRGGLAGDGS